MTFCSVPIDTCISKGSNPYIVYNEMIHVVSVVTLLVRSGNTVGPDWRGWPRA